MSSIAPKIPADVAGEFDVTGGPRGGWTMVFGSETTGVLEAWSKSGPCLEAIADAYAAMRADQAAAEAVPG